MDGTILCQGRFVAPSTIVNQYINIPSNADWMWVYNYTQLGAAGSATPSLGVKYYWQRGMAAGTGVVEYKDNAGEGLNIDSLVSGGFTLYDASGQAAGALPLVGNAVATTASTNATRPVVSTANTAGLFVGAVVRMSDTAQTDVNGIDMVVGAITPNVSFTLLTATNPLATAPGAIGGAGFYRQINVDDLFYPRHRYVVNVTQAVNAQVSTSVAHGLTPGQIIRFSIPLLAVGAAGMRELDGQAATILSVVDDYNFTINVDTSAYTAFVWPTIAQQPSSFPLLNPVGENTAVSLSTIAAQVPSVNGLQINATQVGLLADSTVNTGFLGMVLGTGGNGVSLGTEITGPAGSAASDVMYWVAGKSSFGGL
jgi:hypothetical protein